MSCEDVVEGDDDADGLLLAHENRKNSRPGWFIYLVTLVAALSGLLFG